MNDLIKFAKNESQLIANNVKAHFDSSKAACAAQLEDLLEKTTGKLDELTKLDVSYGNWMRKETLIFNDEIRRSFDALDRAIDPNVKHITSKLKKLRKDVSASVKGADRMLVTCREHHALSAFAKCTKEQSDEAMKMLDRMDENLRRKFEEIAKFCETVLKAHEMTVKETVAINREKTAVLLQCMEKCIVHLRKWQKAHGARK